MSMSTGRPAPGPGGAARGVEGLLQIIVCPACRSRLVVDLATDELVCTNPGCALAYPITPDGVPVLLVDEARPTRPPDDVAGDPAAVAGPDR